MNKPKSYDLAVPEVLHPESGKMLPALSFDTVSQLTASGWSRVGLMVPLITRASKLIMLQHNQTTKTEAGMLGPLGETSKGLQPVVEQPLGTLYRGLQEETGTREPQTLGLRMRVNGGWFINRWPVGVRYPDSYALAICPPVYVPPHTEERLLAHGHSNEEVKNMYIMSPGDIKDTAPHQLRPGVLDWLAQLEATDFLDWPGEGRAREIDFSSVFASKMVDLDLQMGN